MNYKKTTTLAIFCSLLGIGAMPLSQAQSAHQSLRRGDRSYDKKEFQAAENAYRQALTKKPTDPAVLYNTGNAAYRQGHYPDAVSLYNDAAKRAQDPAFKAEALHNLGNAYLQQRQYRPAVEAYQNSLRLRPGAPGTKSNLQFAKKKLREQEQQQKPQSGENEEQQPPPPGQDQQPPSEPADEPQQEPGDQPRSGDQEPPQPEPNPAPEPDAEGRLSPEQARQRLESAVGPADQRSARRYRQNQRPQERPAAKKDW